MAYRDLREFVGKLESEGELRRVKAEVDPVLEIAEVVQRLRREACAERMLRRKSPRTMREREPRTQAPALPA